MRQCKVGIICSAHVAHLWESLLHSRPSGSLGAIKVLLSVSVTPTCDHNQFGYVFYLFHSLMGAHGL